jgi:hypothetical protein
MLEIVGVVVNINEGTRLKLPQGAVPAPAG